MIVYCVMKIMDEGADHLCQIFATREAAELHAGEGYYVRELPVTE